MGGEVVRRGQPGSLGSGGASPYLRRACHEQASARRMGIVRQLAPCLNAYGVNPGPVILAFRAEESVRAVGFIASIHVYDNDLAHVGDTLFLLNARGLPAVSEASRFAWFRRAKRDASLTCFARTDTRDAKSGGASKRGGIRRYGDSSPSALERSG
jgi:hypothetical protein